MTQSRQRQSEDDGRLRVYDFDGEHCVTSISELERIVGNRERVANSFYLVGTEPNPSLSILVKENMAYIHYFPVPDHPGYRSLCPDDEHLDPDTVVFTMSVLGDETHVDTDGVLPRSMALVAAREFFLKREPPASITWDNLGPEGDVNLSRA